MADLIVMPKLGFNMNEGRLIKWYKKEGETVKKGDPLFSIETDKTSMDIEAVKDGVLRKILLNEGETCPVTLPIAIVAGEKEDIQVPLAEALGRLGKKEAPNVESVQITAQEKSGKDFDVIVIGGGPGGYVAAIRAAQRGKKTAIVEKDRFGGVCLNRGCIPTKVLLRSAAALKEVRESESFGITGIPTEGATLNMKLVQSRKERVISQLVDGVEGLLKANGVTIISGMAEIVDAHTVACNGKQMSTAHIIIATGSTVKQLAVPTDAAMRILTSDDALNVTEIPPQVVIVGGGVIGVEFAYFFASAGSHVTVIEFLDRILPMADEEISTQATSHLTKMGISIHTGAKITAITKDAVNFQKNGTQESLAASAVLMSVGRLPNLGGIDCHALGLKTEKGALVTDEYMRTSVQNIYAIGDVNGKAMLAHTASAEALVAVNSICADGAPMRYETIPSAVYLQPEIAWVGLTETQAKAKYEAVTVGRFPLLASGKAKVEGEEQGFIKVIADAKYHEILGVHLYCIHATDMIAEAALAMNLESTLEEVAHAIHPHPTVSEIYPEAFHAALGQAIHFHSVTHVTKV